jgi:hypothetical protein
MAVLSAILGTIAAAGAIAGTATSLKSAHDAKKANATPAYDADAEKKKAAEQEANANRRRALGETNTQRTSALGNTEGTAIQKKTVLGG